MSVENLRMVFGVVIALVIPLFFLTIYLSSCLSRLSSLRARSGVQLETLLDALRRRRELAVRWLERQKPHTAAERAPLHRIEEALKRLDASLSSARPDEGSEERIPALGRASWDLEEALSRLAQAGTQPAAEPESVAPGLQAELAESETALVAASAAYNQTVESYARARRRGMIRPLVRVLGFVPLSSFSSLKERPAGPIHKR